ncbi:MAG: glycogen synthase GlgA [Rhodothermales bacterium]|nr:glycogen synthase GlgA [Rhodothermales bacterium]MBO6781318.1 glycogen synthase GlgA [Rhodothermales bacterium]
MRVAFCTSETVPFAKTGGLADVSGALPAALAQLDCEVKLFMPLYDSIKVDDYGFVFASDLYELPVPVAGRMQPVNVFYGHIPDTSVEVYLIDCPRYYHRGSLYTNDPDEDERFIVLQQAAFQIMQRYAWSPDILHCNDWQSALMPVMLKRSYDWDALFRPTASVLSIHNIGYQGLFSDSAIDKAGLPRDGWFPGGPYENHGAFSFLKSGLVYADIISTVSETYAHEIQTPQYGAGLDGVLRSRGSDLYGILNGIDPEVWNPATDPYIAANYDAESLDDKVKNKQALLKEFGLPFDAATPVFGIVSRFAEQKGFDLLQPILEPLLRSEKMQLVVLGSGSSQIEDFFSWAKAAFPTQVGVYVGYNEGLAHRVEAGSDCFLMPSHYEPCGLNQMYSLAYGTVPVVRHTGGLADTVRDWHEMGGQGNGFSFYDPSPYALMTTIKRAINLFSDQDAWREMQLRGMSTDFSWDRSARRYLDIYWRAIHKRRGE